MCAPDGTGGYLRDVAEVVLEVLHLGRGVEAAHATAVHVT